MQEIRLTIALPKNEYLALEVAGDVECRRPREHARWLLRQALQERGLLPDDQYSTVAPDSEGTAHATANG